MMPRHSSLALAPWQKRTLYGVTVILWVSGACWLYLRYLGGQDEPETTALPTQSFYLKIHGAAAMIFLLVLGTLLLSHVRPGWKQNRQRPSGTPLLAVCGLLIVTGWGLYYIGSEQLRGWNSVIHSVAGIALPVVIFAHVWFTRRKERHAGLLHPFKKF